MAIMKKSSVFKSKPMTKTKKWARAPIAERSFKSAITARGFNTRFADKLLVLIDGRSVYTPSFSGVFWDVQDYALADVERIEVIRGPGGTLWGANAVNGVINIITRKAKDTQGWLASGGGGTSERAFGTARYGTALGEDAQLRGYKPD